MKIIPKTFDIYGKTYRVEYQNDLIYDENVFGMASYRNSKILLQKQSETTPISDSEMEFTFLHELMHHVFYAVRDDRDCPMHEDEALVERVAGILHQVIKTAKF